LAHKQLFVRTK